MRQELALLGLRYLLQKRTLPSRPAPGPGQLNKLALDSLLLHTTPSLQSGLLGHNPSH